jgi:structural maintenance of chromosome 2
MHIKSLVIDGFKSYGKRVELKDFDPKFNAITGLNGTGKSNILDAICFTLGISAMNTIRASTMQDVIYKSGQAGVQTATVTITFDNKDKSRSAPHYSHNDEIVISREVGMGSKNTYRINGITVTAKKIMDFFNSLQMNVNNPHFIIMQGRITKVLNMKPVEILSMIEEAAGTNMYESKKKSLEMAVGKKDNKLREMRNVADEEILPAIDTINKEKHMLEELNIVQNQLKKQKEKLDYWNYIRYGTAFRKENSKLKALEDKFGKKNEDYNDLQKKVNEITNQIEELEKIKEIECGQKVSKFSKELEEKEKEKKSIQIKVDVYENNIKVEVQKIIDLQKHITNSKKDLEAKQKEIENFNKVNAGFEENNKKDTFDLEEIDKKIRSLNSGNIYADEDNGSVQENINKFNLELQNQESENQQYAIKIDALKKKLNQHLTGMKEAQKTYDIQLAQLTAKEKEYEKIKNEYLKTNEELSQHNNLRPKRDGLLRDIRELSSKIESFESNNSSLFFNYNDPQPNFDRQKVHGLVCRLFKPIDFKYELALTTIAGGKLYFVVVEDDSVGKDILEANKFSNRVNFIPLNKIKSNSLPPNVLKIAQQIGGADQVFSAISLIKYDQKYSKAIQWIFGQALVCTTKEVAVKVCFDSRVNRQCFTLEGDHYNPAGNITGGTITQRLVLQGIANQDEIISQLKTKKSEFAHIDNKLVAMANLSDKVQQLQEKHIKVQVELDKIRSDVHLGQPHQQVTEVNSIKQQIFELEKKYEEGKANEKQLQAKIINLETKMKNAKNILKQQLSDAEKTRKSILAKIKNNKAEYDEKKNNFNKLELEIKDLTNQMQDQENQLKVLDTQKKKFESELTTLMLTLNEATIIFNEVFKIYESQKEKALKTSDEIKLCINKKKELSTELKNCKITILEMDMKLSKDKKMVNELEQIFIELGNKLSDDQKHIAEKMDFSHFNSGKIIYCKIAC